MGKIDFIFLVILLCMIPFQTLPVRMPVQEILNFFIIVKPK